MQKTIVIQDRMEVRASDYTNIQAFARHEFDQLISDAVTRIAPGYVGFNVTKNGNTELGIAVGRIYRTDGAMFELEAAQTRSIVSILPSATKRLVAVIAYGQEEDSRSETRDFLVDLESDTVQPRIEVVERRRAVVIDLVPGQESATLPLPTISSSLLVLGWVVLGTAGIESITMEKSTKLPSVTMNDQRITSIETWRAEIEPRINTIASDITSLKAGINGRAGQDELLAALRDIARMKERLEIPDDASDYGADRFLTTDETDVANLDLLCLVEEGIRFSNEAQNETQISLFNPLDGNVFLAGNGLILPAISGRVSRLKSTSAAVTGSINIAQYGFQTHAMKQITVARERLRYGPAYTVCNNNQWWKAGTYDSATNTFKSSTGETFLVLDGTAEQNGARLKQWEPNKAHTMVRIQQFWVDKWEDSYWVAQVTDRTVAGAQICQTFLNSQDGWLSQLNLRLTDKGPDGDISVAICETMANGTPDPLRLLTFVTVPYANLKVAPINTLVDFMPTFLEAGKRYGILITTTGSHKIAVVDTNAYSQGTLFTSTDGAYYAGDLTKDIFFELLFLAFKAARVEIQLAPLQLSGGIANIDVLAPQVVPGSCDITHEVQLVGAWRPLNELTPNLLIGLPALLPHRIVMTGTTAVAPGIQMQNSRIKVWRQRTAFKHISTRQTLATPASTIYVDLTLGKFDAARHTCLSRLKKDDGTYIAASGFADTPVDGERIMRRFSFTASPAISAFKIEFTATTNNALVPFHGEERVHVAI